MNRISLEWTRQPDGIISAVGARGLTHHQLRHYARQAGFRVWGDWVTADAAEPILIGSLQQRDDLLCLLEVAGYEIDAEEIVMPEPRP